MSATPRGGVLRSAFRNVRGIIYFSVAFSCLYNLLRLTGPLFMILIYDRVLPSRSEATLVALFLFVLTFLLVMTMLDYSRRRILARVGAQFQEQIEDHILKVTPRSAYMNRSGNKPTDGLDEVDQLRGFFHSSSLVSILDFVWSPIFLLAVFLIHPGVGWVVVGGLVMLCLIVAAKAVFAGDREQRYNDASNSIGQLKDMLAASRDVIQSQQMIETYNERWMRARRTSRDRAIELKDWNAWFTILTGHSAMLMQYSVLAAGAYFTLNDQLTIGAMVACMFLSVRVFYPAQSFAKQLPRIGRAISDWKNLNKVLKGTKPAPLDLALGAAPTLSVSGLSVRSLIADQKVLRAVDLEIRSGSAVEIVGKSGSGKTVLAEAILGRMPRSGGKVLFGGFEIERLSIPSARQAFGYIPQNVAFVNGTIEDNITGLDVEPDRDWLAQVARIAQVHDLILSLPNGYATAIDAVGSCFSKSERHQIALARALYWNPRVLIVDEPDQTFRESLSKNPKSGVASILDRGGILIVLSRVALKMFNPTKRFSLENGQLTENRSVAGERARAISNVVKLSEQKLLENKMGVSSDEN